MGHYIHAPKLGCPNFHPSSKLISSLTNFICGKDGLSLKDRFRLSKYVLDVFIDIAEVKKAVAKVG